MKEIHISSATVPTAERLTSHKRRFASPAANLYKLKWIQLLKERYRIVAQIGKGGMGTVYKAEDMLFDNHFVAVKELNQSGLNAQEMVEASNAFKREAHLLVGLDHPNLPKIHDYFADAGRWYLVMDFIDGDTLETYVTQRTGGYLPVREALDIGMQLCTVLDYLHTRQPPIIFRDLKPDNVIRAPDGHLYLIDFGIARHFHPGQAKDTMALGSLGYAAPELQRIAARVPATQGISHASPLLQKIPIRRLTQPSRAKFMAIAGMKVQIPLMVHALSRVRPTM